MRRVLHTGPLSLAYQNGEIRSLRLGETEVVRRVYAAVRDRNWGTIALALDEEKILDGGDHFRITFQARHQQESEQENIGFTWRGEIIGSPDGTLQFSFDGVATTSFWRNRIGFCVLHPITYGGVEVEIEHPDESCENSDFPISIAPDPPFQNIRSLSHQVTPEVKLKIAFEGDTFETEDQRNWTDASLKTYCTPLDLPFPVLIEAGDRVFQRIVVTFEGPLPPLATAAAPTPVQLSLGSQIGVFPALGLGVSPEAEILSTNEVALLQELHLNHLRVDVHLADSPVFLLRAVEQANALNCALEVALFVGESLDEAILDDVIRILQPSRITSFLVYKNRTETVSNSVFNQVAARLREAFVNAPIGAGSNANFVEFNRRRPPMNIDFAAYAANPQVHAFDDESIMETPVALGQTVPSARQIVGEKALKVSPLTLKPLFNAVATSPNEAPPTPGARPANADPRQFTPFCAAWLLASLAALCNNGLGSIQEDSLTLFETKGWRGVLAPDGSPSPTWHLLRDLAAQRGQLTFATQSSDDSRVMALAVGDVLWLANLTPQTQQVVFGASDNSSKHQLDGYGTRALPLTRA